MTSELINFENDLIKFENIDINDGMIYFFFVINKEILQENNSDLSSYNRLVLSEVGVRKDPIELSFLVGDYTLFNISIIIKNIIETKEEINYEDNPKCVSQKNVCFRDRLNAFSNDDSNSNNNESKKNKKETEEEEAKDKVADLKPSTSKKSNLKKI